MTQELRPLIRLAKMAVDERQRGLAGVIRRIADLEARRRELALALDREQRVARDADAVVHAAYAGYAVRAVEQDRQLASALANAEAEVRPAQDAVHAAHRELRKLELAQQRRDRRRAEAEARREQAILDEIGAQRHRRDGSPHGVGR